jgi:hypothetical protein
MNSQVILLYQQSTIYTEWRWSFVASYLRRGSSDRLWQRVRQEPQRFVWHLGCVQHPRCRSVKRVCCPHCSISIASANKPSLSTVPFFLLKTYRIIQYNLLVSFSTYVWEWSKRSWHVPQCVIVSVRLRAGPAKEWLWLDKACATRQMPCYPDII